MKKYLTLGMTFVIAVMAVGLVSAGLFGITGNALWDWNYCSSSNPCDVGEGDCDGSASSEFVADDGTKWRKSDQCKSGYCHLDVGEKYGQKRSLDICEEYGNPTEELKCEDVDFNCDGKVTPGDAKLIADYWQNGVKLSRLEIERAYKECTARGEYLKLLESYGQDEVLIEDFTGIGDLVMNCYMYGYGGSNINGEVIPAEDLPENIEDISGIEIGETEIRPSNVGSKCYIKKTYSQSLPDEQGYQSGQILPEGVEISDDSEYLYASCSNAGEYVGNVFTVICEDFKDVPREGELGSYPGTPEGQYGSVTYSCVDTTTGQKSAPSGMIYNCCSGTASSSEVTYKGVLNMLQNNCIITNPALFDDLEPIPGNPGFTTGTMVCEAYNKIQGKDTKCILSQNIIGDAPNQITEVGNCDGKIYTKTWAHVMCCSAP